MTELPNDHSDIVKEHFEIKYQGYDTLIQKLIPKYQEMHQATVDVIDFPNDQAIEVLDLGIGTGQTALEILHRYPYAKIAGVDLSPKMLDQAKNRLANKLDRVTLHEADIKDIDITRDYDAAIGVLSIHHLNEEQKKELFHKVAKHLKEGGIFTIGDIVKFDTNEETEAKEEEWKSFLKQNFGAEEGQYWFDNYKEEDLPSSVNQQLLWLRESGFKEVGVKWENMNYAVFYGKK